MGRPRRPLSHDGDDHPQARSSEPRTAKIEPYQLHNGRPGDGRPAKELFQRTAVAASGGGRAGRLLTLAGLPPGAGDGAVARGRDRFAVERRTNTLIAAGTPAQLKIVESLVYRLDDERSTSGWSA